MKMNKKGFIYLDLIYFLFAMALVAVGFALLFFGYHSTLDNNYKKIALSKDAYQVTQLGRNYLETPMSFKYTNSKGVLVTETKTIADWAVFYFTYNDADEKRLGYTKFALKKKFEATGAMLKPYLDQRSDTRVNLIYNEGGEVVSTILIAASSKKAESDKEKTDTNKEKTNTKTIRMSKMDDSLIKIRIPTYIKSQPLNPTYAYLTLLID